MPFLVASLLCAPFLAVVTAYLIELTLSEFATVCPQPVDAVFLTGVFLISGFPVVSLTVLTFVSISVLAAWRQERKSTLELIATGAYSAVMLVCIAYAVWCLVTKPKFDL